MKQLIIIVACCFLSINILAQVENSEITIGITHTIRSSVLNQAPIGRNPARVRGGAGNNQIPCSRSRLERFHWPHQAGPTRIYDNQC